MDHSFKRLTDSMRHCPSCGNVIDDNANVCPHCGADPMDEAEEVVK
jgi:RNA polymerase subunit RPABC4/transcription elongation factor Spt4